MSVNFIINQIKEKWNNLTRGVSVIMFPSNQLNFITIDQLYNVFYANSRMYAL